MADLCDYAKHPLSFIFSYVRRRPFSHAVILTAVLCAVACSVGSQYGVKFLVDTLSHGVTADVWTAFILLGALIAADNLLWRLASWIGNYAFVAVTGDLRRDLFRHLTGHSPSYFAERLPGTLTSRVTATSNAVFTGENMFVWNVLPPCAATVAAIALVGTVSLPSMLLMDSSHTVAAETCTPCAEVMACRACGPSRGLSSSIHSRAWLSRSSIAVEHLLDVGVDVERVV